MILILSARHDPHAEAVARKLRDRTALYLWFDPAEFPAASQITVSSTPPHVPNIFCSTKERTSTCMKSARSGIAGRVCPNQTKASPTIEFASGYAKKASRSSREFGTLSTACMCQESDHSRYAAENKLKQLVQASQTWVLHSTHSSSPIVPQCLLNRFSKFEGAAITKVLSNPVVPRGEADDESGRHSRGRSVVATSRIVAVHTIRAGYHPGVRS